MRLKHTSYSHVIDSYAWIEYFKASPEGERAKKYVEGEGSATPVIVVAEVSRKLLREVEAGKGNWGAAPTASRVHQSLEPDP